MKKEGKGKSTGKSKHKAKKISAKQGSSFKMNGFLGLALVMLLGIIIYSNTFGSSFHFDDLNNIVDNGAIRDLSSLDRLWSQHPTRFITMFSFAVNYHFAELEVWGYHFVNLLIHLMNTLLVYWLTLLIFSTPALKGSVVAANKMIVAVVVAALFVSHPLATQSVTYIVQRLASMVTLFYLLSVCLYMQGRLAEAKGNGRYLFYGGAFVAAVLAMLSKENGFTLPLAIVLTEVCFFQTKSLSLKLKGYPLILLISAVVIIIGVVFFQFSLSIFDPLPPSQGNAVTITPWNYFMTQWSVILKYIQLLILPVNLNVDYDYAITSSIFQVRALGSLVILLGIVAAGVLLFKKYRLISFGVFWFFIALAIESSFVPINDVIFEHRTYLPSVGFFLIIAYLVFEFLWSRNRNVAIGVLVLLVGINAVLSYQRNKVWETDLTLWNDVIEKSPEKARPYFNRALAYESTNAIEQAIADYTKAIAINPAYTNAWSNRGLAHLKLGQFDQAISDNQKALEVKPSYAPAFGNLGLVYDEVGQLEKAIEAYSQAIALDDKSAVTYSNRGITYGKLGQWDKSIADFDKALELNPGYQEALKNKQTAIRLREESGEN